MKRYLTGIQSSGTPHLGNILGAILPALKRAAQPGNEAYYFIADMHSLTSLKDGALRKIHTRSVAAAWLACGLDPRSVTLYRQSMIPEVTELTWYLNCFTPYPMLANAHSFKDKSDRLADVNAGLFVYPVLMAADILLYDTHVVPVGKDQLQHLEITRDIALKFNHEYGDVFVVPESETDNQVMLVPGTDGGKMSKSYHNYIDVFLPEKELLKVIKTIVTDSTPLEQPKNPDTCIVFKLFSLVGSPEQTADLRQKYLAGNFGYGHAKQAFYDLILERFKSERTEYSRLINDPGYLEKELSLGEDRARNYAAGVLKRVRQALGFSSFA